MISSYILYQHLGRLKTLKTFRDIINMVSDSICCHIHNSCHDYIGGGECSMWKFCGVDSKFIALDYLYRGEYYG